MALRRSLAPPVAQLNVAAELLSRAADAMLAGRPELAASLIAEADMPEVRQHAIRLVGKMSVEVHRRTQTPRCLPKAERDHARMPVPRQQIEIFARDGWRCRFCGTKVICKAARTVLIRAFPQEAYWPRQEFKRHAALYALASSLDHVVPHARGGRNEVGNFVTACYCCQFGRGQWLLQEVEVEDPRVFPPLLDDWDGLRRIS